MKALLTNKLELRKNFRKVSLKKSKNHVEIFLEGGSGPPKTPHASFSLSFVVRFKKHKIHNL